MATTVIANVRCDNPTCRSMVGVVCRSVTERDEVLSAAGWRPVMADHGQVWQCQRCSREFGAAR